MNLMFFWMICVIKDCDSWISILRQCPLWVCPELDQYEAAVGPVSLGLAGIHQQLNASLALQLSYSWLQRHKAAERGGRCMVSLLKCSMQVTRCPSKCIRRAYQTKKYISWTYNCQLSAWKCKYHVSYHGKEWRAVIIRIFSDIDKQYIMMCQMGGNWLVTSVSAFSQS